MKARITWLGAAAGLLVALFVTFVILEKIPSGDYLFVPDIAHPVAPLVIVNGAKKQQGGGALYFVDVHEIPASEFDILFRRWLYPHSSKVPASRILPPGTNNHQYIQTTLRQMASSRKIAAAVAERELGYPVVMHNNGVLVDAVYGGIPATAKIDPADIIVAANGKSTPTLDALHAVTKTLKPGDIVDLTILRGSRRIHESVKTVANPQDKSRAFIGLQVEQSATIQLPVGVSIDSEGIGGPSAGLAFTLEVMRKLGRDVTHGYRVAVTGTISINGTVGPIGGIKQKVWGVRDAGAQVFLVPAGENAKTARKLAGPDLKIIPVTSLKQALRALAALPKLP